MQMYNPRKRIKVAAGKPVFLPAAPGRVVSSPSPVSRGASIPSLAAPALFHLDLCFRGHISCDSPVSLSWNLGITLGPPDNLGPAPPSLDL